VITILCHILYYATNADKRTRWYNRLPPSVSFALLTEFGDSDRVNEAGLLAKYSSVQYTKQHNQYTYLNTLQRWIRRYLSIYFTCCEPSSNQSTNQKVFKMAQVTQSCKGQLVWPSIDNVRLLSLISTTVAANGWGQLWLTLKAKTKGLDQKDTHLTQVIPKLRLFGSA